MVFPKAVFCRVFQAAFRMALPVLPYRQPRILSACARLGERIREEKARSVLVVTDKGILRNGLAMPVEAALRESGMGPITARPALMPSPILNPSSRKRPGWICPCAISRMESLPAACCGFFCDKPRKPAIFVLC